MKIISWNVNGIAACRRKGFLKFLSDTNPDIVCCQEVRSEIPLNTPGYLQYWNPAKQKGYAGTLILTRREPLSCVKGMGIRRFDDEGRLIALEFKEFYLVNVYVPTYHPHSDPERLEFRLAWDKALRKFIDKLQKPVVLCGDFNVTRAFIDSYPENQKAEPDDPIFRSDFRGGFERLLSIGLVDVFRTLYPNREGAYTWWGPKSRRKKDRELNRGSRLDYFLLSGELLPFVQSVKHHVDNIASDHCPISLCVNPSPQKEELDDEDLTALWRTIDWPKMREELARMQRALAMAAYERNWGLVEQLQKKLVSSWCARVLAVQTVADSNAEIGVDGVRWTTDLQKARAARLLTSRGYRPLPYRHTEIRESDGRLRVIHVPAARDKAMLVLYAYALDPVAESTADRKSFSARKGRSALDAHAYLLRDLSGQAAPSFVVKVDIKAYYTSILQDQLLQSIPMDKGMLRKFLKAGVIRDGELFETDRGISLGTSLSPILGNMLLDGLQSCLYDNLYPNGHVDYLDGNLIRFADDMIITVRSWERAELVLQIVSTFVEERGLRLNPEKTYIRDVAYGFDFLGRHYWRRRGVLYAKPSEASIQRMDQELEDLILNFKGSLRVLIEKINKKLRGYGSYHRVEDAYMEFRHIDAVVEGLLVKRMCGRYPRWHRETVLRKFWVMDGGDRVFALPADPAVRVMLLAPTPIVRHKPCKLKFNPYLDDDYLSWLRHRRDVQKVTGKFRAVWTRQDGKCAYCGLPMQPDQEVEVIEKDLGVGHKVWNLLYIHRQCANDTFSHLDEGDGNRLDLFALLDGMMDESPEEESPYLELTEYFRLCDRTPVSLSFREIERILGDSLDWEAYFYRAFWYDDTPEMMSSMWREEGFPFHVLQPSDTAYCIAESWLSQGYRIKSLHLDKQRVVFRRVVNYQSGLVVPRALTAKKLPDAAVHESNQFFAYLMKKYGL